jgi:ribosome maturation factor RimP
MTRLESVRALAAEVAVETGVELFDVEFNGSQLRVFVEGPGGTTVTLCARFSELLARKLDESNVILDRYFLEVSSPGLERKLRGIGDFQRFVGRLARVVTPDGVLEGVILRTDPERVVLETPGPEGTRREHVVALADIRRANLKLNDKELFARPRAGAPAAESVKEIR